ncbi:39S ribosomal protein S18a, mitochondrial-like [Ctenocephalides felis]|uniref:39S ribosomal protein S18a, mitochondrial-like n=1 Tax=Ctenocephalides felis TaxID=7515 RepID=UPI000E6E18EC|nr:39S ribosomal protein S18a, mitochondrial-like [Ctenocephalides felis]
MNFLKRISIRELTRPFFINKLHTTPTTYLKEIKETKSDKELVIEGVILPSPREPLLYQPSQIPKDKHVCPLCATGLDVKHTDVLILSQFLRSDGCMLPRRITGLCKRQQRRVTTMVAMAQKAGLMLNIGPSNSKKDPKRRYKWKKFNTYFDENTMPW